MGGTLLLGGWNGFVLLITVPLAPHPAPQSLPNAGPRALLARTIEPPAPPGSTLIPSWRGEFWSESLVLDIAKSGVQASGCSLTARKSSSDW